MAEKLGEDWKALLAEVAPDTSHVYLAPKTEFEKEVDIERNNCDTRVRHGKMKPEEAAHRKKQLDRLLRLVKERAIPASKLADEAWQLLEKLKVGTDVEAALKKHEATLEGGGGDVEEKAPAE